MDVYKLVGIVLVAIKALPESLWEKSFIMVNQHPQYFISSEDWIKKIYDKVKTGETKYMGTNEDSYYDEMPTVWKNMPIKMCHRVLSIIDDFSKHTEEQSINVWMKESCLLLLPYCKLQDIPKL
eukprot:11604664-Ditylum_brightwellii.AAC.1